jgi:RNA-directed DNA polymerase
LLALIALHGMDEAITRIHPQARVIAYADDCVVLHEDRRVLEQSQQLLRLWLAEIGLTLHETKSHICHTLEGEDPGFEFLGFHIRQYRVGKHQSGKRPGGQRLGYKTLIKPAKANIQEHLAELGRIMRRSKALPQGEVIRQLNPAIRGWAHRRHPTKATPWVIQRYCHRLGTRLTLATSATAPHAGHLHTHSEHPSTRHIKVRGTRSPYDGDWVYWSTRQGRHPGVSPRLAMLLKQQRGRCAYCGLFCHDDDRIEIDHIDGDRRHARMTNLQALHGHCHEAKTREQGDSLPHGMRDQHQDTEERSAR